MLARVLWPGQNPIGQRIRLGGDAFGASSASSPRCTWSSKASCAGEMYLPIRQTDDYASVHLIVRTDLPPAALASSVRAALAPIEPNLPNREWRTMQDLVDKAVVAAALRRLAARRLLRLRARARVARHLRR